LHLDVHQDDIEQFGAQVSEGLAAVLDRDDAALQGGRFLGKRLVIELYGHDSWRNEQRR
jgi:hypothetical protein